MMNLLFLLPCIAIFISGLAFFVNTNVTSKIIILSAFMNQVAVLIVTMFFWLNDSTVVDMSFFYVICGFVATLSFWIFKMRENQNKVLVNKKNS